MGINLQPNDIRIDDARLSQFEAAIATRFPQDYRSFLLDSNGGTPESNVVTIGDTESFDVRTFFGVDDTADGLARALETYRERVPENAVPIADDNCGNLFVLAINGRDSGNVYFWDHEFEADEGEPPRNDNLTLVARSFSELLDQLEPSPADDVTLKPGQVKSVWVDPEFKAKLERGEL